MLGALLAGGFFDYLQNLIITTYVVTAVFLTFFVINLNLDRQYILLSEKLLASKHNDENLPLRINLAFKERRVRFSDLSDNPWESSDGGFFGGSSSGGGASDDW
jgi:uncharacterized membrane protein YgcG